MSSFSLRTGARFVAATLFVAALAWSAGANRAVAQQAAPLQWKFAAGETLHYRMTQNMKMGMVMGEREMGSTMRQDIDMSWAVKEVADDGSASLEQKIDRMRMKMDMAGNSMEYDSASTAPPQGMAAMVAPVMKELTKAAFDVKMTPRGQVSEVQVPASLLDALKNSQGAAMMGELLSEKGFKQMIEKGSLVLPEKLAEGTTWNTEVKIENPMFGSQIVTTTYAYKGSREVDGRTMEVFEPKLTMNFAGGANSPATLKVSKQDSSGEILFDREAGRLASSKINMNMALDVTTQGNSFTQKIDQVIEMRYVSEDELKADK